MTQPVGLEVRAEVRVQRGKATHCACGGELVPLGQPHLNHGEIWGCLDCGREYE